MVEQQRGCIRMLCALKSSCYANGVPCASMHAERTRRPHRKIFFPQCWFDCIVLDTFLHRETDNYQKFFKKNTQKARLSMDARAS